MPYHKRLKNAFTVLNSRSCSSLEAFSFYTTGVALPHCLIKQRRYQRPDEVVPLVLYFITVDTATTTEG